VNVTEREVIASFKCMKCSSKEIVPLPPNVELIDLFALVTDKWLAQRYKRNFEVPHWEIELNKKELKYAPLFNYVTIGTVTLFVTKRIGGERLPIKIEDAMKLPKERSAVGKVQWPDVIGQIIETGEFYSAKEVTAVFVEGQVRAYRTKAVLDHAVEEGLLARVWDGKKYLYGKPFGE